MALIKKSALPGFGLTMGFTIFYLSLMVLLPIVSLMLSNIDMTLEEFWETVTAPQAVASYRVTVKTAVIAALANMLFGFIVAWVLVRYQFPGKRLVDAMVDLPFALPTAVSGIALFTIYSEKGWFGKPLLEYLGLRVVGEELGIIMALTFIGLPFVVRTLQPALEDLEHDVEEAAASLGANRLQTFLRVILPSLFPAMITGFALSLARGIGEYGSVVFVAGNIPMKTEITPLLIMKKLDSHNYDQATAIAVVLLGMSFVMLLVINLLQLWSSQRYRKVS